MCWIGTGTFGKYCCSTTARSSLHKFYLCAIRPNWRKDALEKLCTSSGVQRHLKQDHWSPLRWFCVVDSNSILKCLKHFNQLRDCWSCVLGDTLARKSQDAVTWAQWHGFCRSVPAVTATNLEIPCVWSHQSNQPKLCLSSAQRAQPLILQSKPSIVFWKSLWDSNSAWEWLSDDRQRLELGLKPELCCLTNELWRFYMLQSPKINCVEFEFFWGQ